MQRYDRLMQHIYDHVRGYWSLSLPAHEGMYLMRVPNERGRPWVSYWEPDPSSPFGTPSAERQRREFFHVDGDAEGRPTRWDDRGREPHTLTGSTSPAPSASR